MNQIKNGKHISLRNLQILHFINRGNNIGYSFICTYNVCIGSTAYQIDGQTAGIQSDMVIYSSKLFYDFLVI